MPFIGSYAIQLSWAFCETMTLAIDILSSISQDFAIPSSPDTLAAHDNNAQANVPGKFRQSQLYFIKGRYSYIFMCVWGGGGNFLPTVLIKVATPKQVK